MAATDRPSSGPDHLSVVLFSLAAFLIVFAVLASELRTPDVSPTRQLVVVRKLYTTTVIETIKSTSPAGGTSVSQSVSSSGTPNVVYAAPVTGTSGSVR